MNLLTYALSIYRSRVEQFACLQASWARKTKSLHYAGHLSENKLLWNRCEAIFCSLTNLLFLKSNSSIAI